MNLSLRKTIPLFLLLSMLACLFLLPAAYAAAPKLYTANSAEELESKLAEANAYCQGNNKQAVVYVSGSFETEYQHEIVISRGVALIITEGYDVGVSELEVQDGGAVELEPGARFSVYNTLALNGPITVGDEDASAELHIPAYGVEQIPYDRIDVPSGYSDWDRPVCVHYHPEDANTLYNMVDEANGMGWPYQGNIQVNFDWSLSRELSVDGFTSIDLNSGEQGGSLIIGRNGRLIVNNWISANGAEISTRGTLENNGNINLNWDASVSVGSSGAYSGAGMIHVRENTADPDDLVDIAGLTRVDVEDETVYYNADSFWDAFAAACENNEGYFDLSDRGSFTIQEGVTIPSEMYVESWDTEIIVPEDVTLTVKGNVNANALTVHGAVSLEDWGFIYAGTVTVDGDLWLNGENELHTNYADSQAVIGSENVHFSRDYNRIILMDGAYDDDDFNSLWGTFKALPDHYGGKILINYDMEMYGYFDAFNDKSVQIEIKGNQQGSLTVAEGATLNADYLGVHGATMTVHGKLISNSEVHLHSDWNCPVGQLIFDSDDCYENNPGGYILVSDTENTDAQIVGLNLDRFVKFDRGDGITYNDNSGLFEFFEEACNSNYQGQFNLNDLGGFKILRDITVPKNMHVSAWSTNIVVPEGVTLTVLGNVNTSMLTVNGAVTLENWGFVYAHDIILGQEGQINVTGNNYMKTYYEGSENIVGDPRIHFGPGNVFELELGAGTEEDFNAALTTLKQQLVGYEHFIGRVRIEDTMSLSGETVDMHDGKPVFLTVADGATLTVPTGTTLNADVMDVRGATLEVNGKLIGNATIRVEGDDGETATLSFANDACYEGNPGASIFLRQNGDGPVQLLGLNTERFTKYERGDGVFYYDNPSLFAQFKAAIQSNAEFYNLRDKGALELEEDVTIPAGMTVDATNTRIFVPVGNHLTVEGTLILTEWQFNGITDSIVIHEGGQLYIANSSGLAGNIWEGWMENGSVERVTFGPGVVLELNFYVENDEQMKHVFDLAGGIIDNYDNIRFNINVLYPLTMSGSAKIPDEIAVFLHDDFRIPAGVTLKVFGTLSAKPDVAINVNGTLLNYGFVELSHRDSAAGALLRVNGSYDGYGTIGIMDHGDVASYVSGIDLGAYEAVEDNVGTRFFYNGSAFVALKAACERGDGEFNIQNFGEFTIEEDLTIPQNMRVRGWGTEIVVPEGVTLTVLGNVNASMLTVNGTVTLENWGFVYAHDIILGQEGQINVTGNNNMKTYYEGSENIVGDPRIHFGPGNVFELELGAGTAEEFNDVLDTLKQLPEEQEHFIGRIRVEDSMSLSGDMVDMHGGKPVFLTIADGATVTMPAGTTLNADVMEVRGATLEVNGTLIGNAGIRVEGEDGMTATLDFASDASYVGNADASIFLRQNGDGPVQLLGLNTERFTIYERGDGVFYYDNPSLFAQFKAAIQSGVEYYDLRNRGALELEEDVTIPAGMTVDATSTRIFVPVGNHLIVEGKLILTEWNLNGVTDSIVIPEGGELHIANSSGLAGNIWEGWMDNGSVERVTFGPGVVLDLNFGVQNDEQMRHVYEFACGIVDSYDNIRCNIDVHYPSTMPGSATIPGRVTLFLHDAFTVPAGVTLTVDGTLSAKPDVAINVNGTLVNNGFVELTHRNNAADAMLRVNGRYEGFGTIGIMDHGEVVYDYLNGVDLGAYDAVEDNVGVRFFYKEDYKRFALLKTACERGDDYCDLSNLGYFTIEEDLTIPQNMRVRGWGTEIVVPEGVTLTVRGHMDTSRLTVNGTVTLENWGFVYADDIFLGGEGEINITGNNYMKTYYYGSEHIIGDERIHFGPGNVLEMEISVRNEEEFDDAFDTFKQLDAEHFVGRIRVCNSMNLSGETLDMNGGKPVFLTVADGATLTVPEGTTLNADVIEVRGSTLDVIGTMIGNAAIRVEGENGMTATLNFASDACYVGNAGASIFLRQNGNGEAQLVGLDTERFTVYERGDGVFYYDNPSLFAQLKEACLSNAEFFNLRNMGALELEESITIPAGMTVDATSTRIVIPEGKQLTVEGKLILTEWNFNGVTNCVVIPEGGELYIASWSGLAGNIWRGWVDDGSINGIRFADNAGVILLFFGYGGDDAEGLLEAYETINDKTHIQLEIHTNEAWTVSEDVTIPAGVKVYLEKNLTVADNAMLSVHGTLSAWPDVVMTVNGTLLNNSFVEMNCRSDASHGAMLRIYGNYRGLGSFGVKDLGDSDSYFTGLDLADFRRETDSVGNMYYFNKEPDIFLPDALVEIGEEAFAGGAFSFVVLPGTTEEIGPRAFADCPDLAYIFIPGTTEQIAGDAFDGTVGLQIICPEGSTAAQFAEDNGFNYWFV